MNTEVAHYSAMVALLFLLGCRRHFPREYWAISFAYMVSWAIDSAVDANRGGFGAAHVLIALQAAMFAEVMIARKSTLLMITFALAVGASLAPFVMMSDPHRMVFVLLWAILVLMWAIWHWDHPLKWAVGTYVVVAGLLSAWMVQYFPDDRAAFNDAFVVYTLARFASYGLFIHTAYNWREA